MLAEKVNRKLKNKNILIKKGKKKGKPLTISKSQINRILKEKFGKARKVRKVFYLNEDHQKKRIKFCKKLLKMKFEGKNFFFTDETKIDLEPPNDQIRLGSQKKKEVSKGKEEALKLVTVPVKKHESSIMVSGGISYYGLSDLFLLNGNMNNFAYSQTLNYFKKNYDKFNKKNLYFEQDGARAHTSKENINLLNELFPKKWVQNSPNSPDIAYPIETLWARLKRNVKFRHPKNLEDLKKITI